MTPSRTNDSVTIRGYDRQLEIAVDDVVLVDYVGTEPAMAVVVNPKPYPERDVVRVKYLHSNTGAYIAARRILNTVNR